MDEPEAIAIEQRHLADRATERLPTGHDWTLTNLGGHWRVVLTCRQFFDGCSPDEAVDVALAVIQDQALLDLITLRNGFNAEKNAKLEAIEERDENFGTIKTICKVLCDLECENGCDEGLEYEGDEWVPCSCIYRWRQLVNVIRSERNIAEERRDKYGSALREIAGRGANGEYAPDAKELRALASEALL